MFRSILIAGVLLAGGVGCESTYKQDVTEVKSLPEPLTAKSRVYIAMPEDAIDKKNPVAASGKRTSIGLQEAFQRHTKGLVVAKIPETLEDALRQARQFSCDYVVYPSIVKWEDRPTEWTGVRDKLEIKVDIVDANSGELIRSSHIQGMSKWMAEGGEAPQDLLADPLDKFVRGLFRVPLTPSALQK